MQDVIINIAAQVVSTLLITLIGVLGAWLTAKIGKRVELTNINKAKDELIVAAQQTVMELQQTVVEGLKEKAVDGKLTDEEIEGLCISLLTKTKEKMSLPAIKVLEAAAVDVNALIRDAGEALIERMHADK
jgi:hypothetical protein